MTESTQPVQTHTMKLSRPIVVLDLETTGTWVERDRIVEIALIKCLPDGTQQVYEKRTNPGMPIPERVSVITGIYDDDVKDAPAFKDIAQEVVDFIADSDLGGFNVERFDLLILERELYTAGHKFNWRTRTVYDAQKIYHLNEKRDLTAGYKFYCSKDLTNAHSALGDTQATVEVLAAQIERYGDTGLGLESLKDIDYKKMDDFFDNERKFRWWNGELYPIFGKYARKASVKQIAQKDPGYFEWLLTTDFSDEVKTMIRGVLQGKFPEPPA